MPMQAAVAGGGVSFDKDGMYSAAQTLDEGTGSANEEGRLYKIYADLKRRIEEEIGKDGTKWNGVQAERFNNKFVNDYEPEFETLHENIHNIADNIREQADAWDRFDTQ